MHEEKFFTQQLGIASDLSCSVQESTLVSVILSSEEENDYSKQVITEVAINLLARVFRHIFVDVPRDTICQLPGGKGLLLHEYLSSIPSQVREWPGQSHEIEERFNVVVGSGEITSANTVYVNSNGWLAFIGRIPTPIKILVEHENNPIGAVVAGCLGAAEIFKMAFGSKISKRVTYVDKPISFSTFSYKVGDYSNWYYLENPEFGQAELNEVTVFGVGSIGSSMLHSLAFVPGLQGSIDVVDSDLKLDVHNLLRYSLLTLQDLHRNAAAPFPKAEWAERKLKELCPNLSVRPFVIDASGYLSKLPHDYKIDVAVSAVDGIPARRDITEVLAKKTLNAASGETNIEISRHRFNDGMACLYCRYTNSKSPLSQVNLFSQMTGLSPQRVIQLLDQDVLAKCDIDILIQLGKISVDERDKWLGNRLNTLINGRLYGQVPVVNSGNPSLSVVTVAFVSLMAGALLAGELLKAKNFSWEASWKGNLYKQDLLHLPNEIIFWEPNKDKCLCNHSFRQNIYRGKYSA